MGRPTLGSIITGLQNPQILNLKTSLLIILISVYLIYSKICQNADRTMYLINSDFDYVMLLHHLGCQSAQR